MTLEWSSEAMEVAPKSERVFTGYGETEILAFFYAARNALQRAEYRDMSRLRASVNGAMPTGFSQVADMPPGKAATVHLPSRSTPAQSPVPTNG